MTLDKDVVLELARELESAKDNDDEYQRCLDAFDSYVFPEDVVALFMQNEVLAASVRLMHEEKERTVDGMAKLMIEISQLKGQIAKLSTDTQARKLQVHDRQAQGIEKAKADGKYKGRPVNEDLHKRVKELLKAGLGVRNTARHASCSATTVMKIRDSLNQGSLQ